MKIRELKESELSELLALYEHLHADDTPLPEKEQLSVVWGEIINSPKLNYFGAFEKERLVASCTISIIPNLTRSCRPYGLIENVVTHPKFRRNGIGRAILVHARNYAWSQNCYKVMLMTGRKDEGTLKFYESAGFDPHSKQAFTAKPEPEVINSAQPD